MKWQTHLKKVRKKNPNLSFRQAQKLASDSYIKPKCSNSIANFIIKNEKRIIKKLAPKAPVKKKVVRKLVAKSSSASYPVPKRKSVPKKIQIKQKPLKAPTKPKKKAPAKRKGDAFSKIKQLPIPKKLRNLMRRKPKKDVNGKLKMIGELIGTAGLDWLWDAHYEPMKANWKKHKGKTLEEIQDSFNDPYITWDELVLKYYKYDKIIEYVRKVLNKWKLFGNESLESIMSVQGTYMEYLHKNVKVYMDRSHDEQ